jgi:hypothetical protein
MREYLPRKDLIYCRQMAKSSCDTARPIVAPLTVQIPQPFAFFAGQVTNHDTNTLPKGFA